jgi:hypothetical protein
MSFLPHLTARAPRTVGAAAFGLLLATAPARAAEPQDATAPAAPATSSDATGPLPAAPAASTEPTPATVTHDRARPLPRGPLLRGPHPFRLENALTGMGGYGVANQFHGLRAGIGFGYELAGSLWFDLHLDVIDADPGNAAERISPPCTNCGKVDTFASVLGGLAYRLRANIPVIPYAAVTAGPIYLFNRDARGAVGMALRSAVGARYYLYEWLGLGVELAGLLGGAVVDESAGLSSTVALFDLGLSAEFQF